MAIEHSIKHDLDPATAKKCLEKALDAYKARFPEYSPTATWVGDNEVRIQFSAKGLTLKGGIKLKPGALEMDLDVPLLLRPLKGVALGVIEEQFRKWVGEAKAGRL
jgi:hypothetical protein